MASKVPSFNLEFRYRRSVGPVVGAFLTGLREGRILGARTPAGRVLVPPLEYDPETGEATGDLVEVGSAGEVRGWTWVDEVEQATVEQPLDAPFGWALVQLDGADSYILHALDAPRDTLRTGMRVRVRWRAEREGHIRDIACFEPEDAA